MEILRPYPIVTPAAPPVSEQPLLLSSIHAPLAAPVYTPVRPPGDPADLHATASQPGASPLPCCCGGRERRAAGPSRARDGLRRGCRGLGLGVLEVEEAAVALAGADPGVRLHLPAAPRPLSFHTARARTMAQAGAHLCEGEAAGRVLDEEPRDEVTCSV
jgi:hypothetical protein